MKLTETGDSHTPASTPTRRYTIAAIVGIVLTAIGLLALWFPVYLDQYDFYGIKVNCGNGFRSDIADSVAVHGDNFADDCGSALLLRRAWAFPAVTVGGVLVAEFLVAWVRVPPPQEAG